MVKVDECKRVGLPLMRMRVSAWVRVRVRVRVRAWVSVWAYL